MAGVSPTSLRVWDRTGLPELVQGSPSSLKAPVDQLFSCPLGDRGSLLRDFSRLRCRLVICPLAKEIIKWWQFSQSLPQGTNYLLWVQCQGRATHGLSQDLLCL